ncbi:MAG: hypothetical protein GY913_35615 [Proteobacteria bacterium]|nr:hypothetical protein [Pseudomonadota bacterium]
MSGETSSEGLVFDLELSTMPDRDPIVVVDPDDRVTECDEDANVLVISATLCE